MYSLAPEIADFRKRFEAAHPDFKFDKMDWLRCSYAFKFLFGSSMLEVGPGVGQMLDAATRMMTTITALDIRKHSKAMFPPQAVYIEQSILKEDLLISPHHTVICMEVIEHLPDNTNEISLRNLRNATDQRLLLSVPFNEPIPLWWHDKPGGHRQRFNIDKLGKLFPHAYGTILPRYGADWAFIVEDRVKSAPYFQLVSRSCLLDIFGIGR